MQDVDGLLGGRVFVVVGHLEMICWMAYVFEMVLSDVQHGTKALVGR